MRTPTQACFESLESRTLLSAYFVSTSGNDAGNGSAASPWRTLQRAADVAAAGDVVNVAAGTYSAGFYTDRSGTAANPITFLASTGTIITGRNTRTPDGINLEGADYVVIDGFTINNTSGTITRGGIRSVLNHHATIRNNVVDGAGTWGIFSGFSDDLLIENNRLSRSIAEHGIYVSNSGDRPIIRNNVSFSNRGCGIHMNGDISMGGDGIISGALVEGNVIYDNGRGGGSGINGDGVQDSTFRNNLLYNNHASGLSLYMIDGGAGSKNNIVANNTILMPSDGRWAINIRDGSTGNKLANNILFNAHSFRGSISVWADSLAGFTSDYNVVMSRFTTNDGDSVQTLAQWRTSTGNDIHSIIATPAQLFANASADDYHLSPTSPAINAGTPIFAPAFDREGTARPSNGAFDIGADEFEPVAPPRAWRPAAIADFDDDGKSDIVFRNTRTGANQLWLMDGATRTEIVPLPTAPDVNWKLSAAADFNGDGSPDLVWRHALTGRNAIWLMDGAARIGLAHLMDVTDTNYDIGGAGDFNGDGKIDLAWRHTTTGENSAWLMNGTSFAGAVAFPSATNLNWKMSGVSDSNADGHADLIFQNTATGQNAVWLMNRTSRAQVAMLPSTAAGSGWRLLGAGNFGSIAGAVADDLLAWNESSTDNVIWEMSGSVQTLTHDAPDVLA
jgi:hypothetical protein